MADSDGLSDLLDKEDDEVDEEWLQNEMMEAQSNDSTDSDSDDYDPDKEQLPFDLQNIEKSPNHENLLSIEIPPARENFAEVENIAREDIQDQGNSLNREELDEDRYEESQLVSDDSFYSAESQIMPDKKPKEEPEEHQPSTRTEKPTGIRYHDDKIALPGKYYVTTKNGSVLPCEVFAARQNPYDR